jgi:hypothetical protein
VVHLLSILLIQALKRGHLLRILIKPIASAKMFPYTILLYPFMILLNLLDGAVSGESFIISGFGNCSKVFCSSGKSIKSAAGICS